MKEWQRTVILLLVILAGLAFIIGFDWITTLNY